MSVFHYKSIYGKQYCSIMFKTYYIVHPLLKKTKPWFSNSITTGRFQNYPFYLKSCKKLVLNQLTLLLNHASDPFQSAFKAKHSTESALLRVTIGINWLCKLCSPCFVGFQRSIWHHWPVHFVKKTNKVGIYETAL